MCFDDDYGFMTGGFADLNFDGKVSFGEYLNDMHDYELMSGNNIGNSDFSADSAGIDPLIAETIPFDDADDDDDDDDDDDYADDDDDEEDYDDDEELAPENYNVNYEFMTDNHNRICGYSAGAIGIAPLIAETIPTDNEKPPLNPEKDAQQIAAPTRHKPLPKSFWRLAELCAAFKFRHVIYSLLITVFLGGIIFEANYGAAPPLVETIISVLKCSPLLLWLLAKLFYLIADEIYCYRSR